MIKNENNGWENAIDIIVPSVNTNRISGGENKRKTEKMHVKIAGT